MTYVAKTAEKFREIAGGIAKKITDEFALIDAELDAIQGENTDGQMGFSPLQAQAIAGTWTNGIASDVTKLTRTAADASEQVIIPLNIPARTTALKGRKITSVEVAYKVATAIMADVTVELVKKSFVATGSPPTAAAVAATYDTGHDTAAERNAVDDHTMVITVDTPAYIADDEEYCLVITADATSAGTSVFTLLGGQVYFSETLVD